jgi:hypothetical protein
VHQALVILCNISGNCAAPEPGAVVEVTGMADLPDQYIYTLESRQAITSFGSFIEQQASTGLIRFEGARLTASTSGALVCCRGQAAGLNFREIVGMFCTIPATSTSGTVVSPHRRVFGASDSELESRVYRAWSWNHVRSLLPVSEDTRFVVVTL